MKTEDFANLNQTSQDSVNRQAYVKNLFDNLAPKYDRFNRWVTFNRDEGWRKEALNFLGEDALNGVVLDLAAGTGDLANSAVKYGANKVHVFDISYEMLALAKLKVKPAGADKFVAFEQGSAHKLPFQDSSITGIVSGFAMRNVFHFLDEVLLEMYRVLKPGGRFAILELSQPQNPILKYGFGLHLKTVMPLIGKLTTGQFSPFVYLGKTTMTFLTAPQFKERLDKAGFQKVNWQTYLLGGIAIHYGEK